MTFFLSGFSPIMQSWLSLATHPSQRGIYFGYATSSRAIGWLLGGMIGLAVTFGFGTRAIFVAGALADIEETDVDTLNEWRKDPAHWEPGK